MAHMKSIMNNVYMMIYFSKHKSKRIAVPVQSDVLADFSNMAIFIVGPC